MKFLGHVVAIIAVVANAEATKQLPAIAIRMLLNVYSYWTDHNLLPKKELFSDNKLTLLDRVDMWLADSAWSDYLLNDLRVTLTGIHIFYLEHCIGFRLRRWARC